MDSPRLDELIGVGFTEDATNSKAPEGRYYTDPELHRFEVQQVFHHPHTTFSVFPGTNMLFVYSMSPNGPDRCAEQIHYFGLDASISEPSSTAEAYVSEQLNHEDIALVESVFRGLQSKGYRPGRMMVDREQQASWSEQFVHRFNQLNISALRRSHH